MRTGKLELLACQQKIEGGGGSRLIEARIRGEDQDLMLFLLERLAADGFEVFLFAAGPREVGLVVRPSVVGGSVQYVDIDQLGISPAPASSFVPGDDPFRVATIIGLRETGNFYPFEYAERLRAVGYRAEFVPAASGRVELHVRPGRSIRRVRVRGHVPVAKRDIVRQLSIDAQPGSLARGECSPIKQARSANPPPICDPRDVACREWERDELARIDEFLFDSGYFDGTARLALVCGRDPAEADLYIYLSKGRGYRADRRDVTVKVVDREDREVAEEDSDLESRDVRWIRRQFIPRVLGVFRTRITREFMDKAVDKVERAYAEPESGLGRFWRSQGSLPYPEVDVHSSYEQLTRETEFSSRNVPIEVRIARGPAVVTEFRPARGVTRKRRRQSGLSFSDSQLRSHVQLFNRREPATEAAARRESANLRAFYQSRGFLFARVEGQHLDFKSMDKLRFEIREGPKVKIAELELVRPARLRRGEARRIEAAFNDERKLRARGNFSETDALADIQSLIAAYNAEGYLCAQAVIYIAFWREGLDAPRDQGTWAALTVENLLDSGGSPKWLADFDPEGLAGVLSTDRAKVWVRMQVDPGPRFASTASEEVRYLEQRIPFSRRVDDLFLREPGAETERWEDDAMLANGPLRSTGGSGVSITPSLEREARQDLVERYQNRGYPVADAELSWRYRYPDGRTVVVDNARNLPSERFGICAAQREVPEVLVEPVISIYEGRPGEFGDILFRGNFKTRTWLLRRELTFETGERYNRARVDASAANIESMGVAKSVTISPYPIGCHFDESGPCQVHQVIVIEEAKDITANIDFGFGAATLNPLYVFVRPSFPNVAGTGWDINLEGRWGFDLSPVLEDTELCAGQDCYERLASATFSHPHIFGTSLDLDINGRVQQQATPARGTIFNATASLRLSRRFREWTFYAGYLFQFANVSKDVAKPLAGSNDAWINRSGGVVSDLTGLFDTGVVVARVDNAFNPYDGFIATMDIKLASPWFGGQDWWARLDLSWQHFIPIPRTQDRLNFRYSLRYGHVLPFHGPGFRGQRVESDTAPDVWRYFGGGTADLGLRGILPETMLVDVEELQLPNGAIVYRPRAQGGHIRAIGTVALQVTSIKNLLGGALAHSLFFDFGVLTQFWEKVSLARDFRYSMGINAIKLDIRIVTMALGYAWLLPGPFNIGPTDDPNGRVVFDVGVTF